MTHDDGTDDKKSGSGETVTRRDDRVGEPGSASGERQTPQQAAITGTEAGGRSDADRKQGWGGGEPGRPPVAVGGASGGHSDRKDADGQSKADRQP